MNEMNQSLEDIAIDAINLHLSQGYIEDANTLKSLIETRAFMLAVIEANS